MKIKYILPLIFFFVQIAFTQNQEEIRIVTYNLLNYPDNYSSRNPDFKKVIEEINPDIVVVQEMASLFGVYTFLTEVLDTSEFVAGPFIPGPNSLTANAIFYNDSLLSLISHVAIPTDLRDISEFTLHHNFTQDTLMIYSVHLKASDGYSNEQQRLSEVTTLRNVTDALPLGKNFIVLGDFNIYSSNEPAYSALLNQSNSGYFVDLFNLPGTWNNISYAQYHTQSTCNLASCPNGGSNGGLDDRFDMILLSQTVKDTGVIEFINGTYTPFGNDGQHYNKSINEPPFNIITQEIANALFNGSDHLPVFADFNFGSVSDVEELEPIITTFTLYQNFPNPFNPTTKIRFDLPRSAYLKLVLYDLLGREIRILFEGEALAGMNEVEFNGENLAGGVYFYTLFSDDFVATKKLVFLK